MSSGASFKPVVCVVGFHHAKGPEIESWFGVEDGHDPATDNDWSSLPFMALSDGAHTTTEDFSYFTLVRRRTSTQPATSLFGISCTRQMDANELLKRPADVTRSTVQKAVVVIADSPQHFGHLREKLSMVTGAWFAQRDFTDVDILEQFQRSLSSSLQDTEDDRDQYLGMLPIERPSMQTLTNAGLSLRELIHEFKYQTLVLFKCCLLQPKMLFFGSRCERLCMMQFSLISLIPGLIRKLEDCADPDLDSNEKNMFTPTSLKTSERNSLLSYMGLPLQLFGKGSLFGPYTPLQQLDVLADYGTKSYIVGSTNSLLLQQKDRHSDILINLDESTIDITSTSLRSALVLSVADRRWIDVLTQTIADTWDEHNPSRPKSMGYMGSEEFIRLQFEEYLLALLASVKYHLYLHKPPTFASFPPKDTLTDIEGDPALDFNIDWIDAWRATPNFALFDRHTDSHLFDIVEPKHPTAGNLTIEDVQRRLAQQVAELHLDERLASSKDLLNKHLATGQKKVSTAFNNLWADIEVMREAQRRRHEELRAANLAAAAPAHEKPPPVKVRNREAKGGDGIGRLDA
ncbi:AVL9/DENND6 domain [Lasallia pustulata]|uniref:AVL9/DENND6 domain n=1 Tax=Lasallia pustulata TaxID=136370 RepID=A0A1W5D7S8_9LECA|nr:AVL9/DENND6 domain [Lasallia pustulata]